MAARFAGIGEVTGGHQWVVQVKAELMDPPTLTISQLAQRFGLNTSAIRYDEPEGVLPQPDAPHPLRVTRGPAASDA